MFRSGPVSIDSLPSCKVSGPNQSLVEPRTGIPPGTYEKEPSISTFIETTRSTVGSNMTKNSTEPGLMYVIGNVVRYGPLRISVKSADLASVTFQRTCKYTGLLMGAIVVSVVSIK